MPQPIRDLYRSANGDRWFLVRDDGGPVQSESVTVSVTDPIEAERVSCSFSVWHGKNDNFISRVDASTQSAIAPLCDCAEHHGLKPVAASFLQSKATSRQTSRPTVIVTLPSVQVSAAPQPRRPSRQ